MTFSQWPHHPADREAQPRVLADAAVAEYRKLRRPCIALDKLDRAAGEAAAKDLDVAGRTNHIVEVDRIRHARQTRGE